MKRASSIRRPRLAFSVVELLVSVGVIAVLAVILFIATKPTLERVTGVNCIANLKTLGVAIQSYINDHNGLLPGALTDGQRLGYDKSASDKNHFPVLLGDYLQLPKPTNEKQYAKSIACPGWERNLGPSGDKFSTPCFIVQKAKAGGQLAEVFGRTTAPKQDPLRHTVVDEPSMQIAVIDADAKLIPNYAGRVPSEPVHGRGFRNALFFDWHVEVVPSGL